MKQNLKVVDIAQIQLARKWQHEEERLRAEASRMDRLFWRLLLGALVVSALILWRGYALF